MAEHPVGHRDAVIAGRVVQGMAKAADPAVIGQDQLDNVGLRDGRRARDEDMADRI
jgi:hypothetical protein